MLLALRLAVSPCSHLHLTLLPQMSGRRNRRRLASPLHGTLPPARISRSRPPVGRTGVSLSLTESLQYSLPQAAFRTDGNRWAPYLGQSLIEAVGENYPPSLSPRFYRWSSRILRRRLPLSERPRQVCIYVFGYAIVKVHRYPYRYPCVGANCVRMLFITIKSSPVRGILNRVNKFSCLEESLFASGINQSSSHTPLL